MPRTSKAALREVEIARMAIRHSRKMQREIDEIVQEQKMGLHTLVDWAWKSLNETIVCQEGTDMARPLSDFLDVEWDELRVRIVPKALH